MLEYIHIYVCKLLKIWNEIYKCTQLKFQQCGIQKNVISTNVSNYNLLVLV